MRGTIPSCLKRIIHDPRRQRYRRNDHGERSIRGSFFTGIVLLSPFLIFTLGKGGGEVMRSGNGCTTFQGEGRGCGAPKRGSFVSAHFPARDSRMNDRPHEPRAAAFWFPLSPNGGRSYPSNRTPGVCKLVRRRGKTHLTKRRGARALRFGVKDVTCRTIAGSRRCVSAPNGG